MSNVDTTSFARILLGAMGQGADIFNRASSGAQSIIDSRDNRAFRDRAFAAQESQRAFGNDLALKDQAIQQAAADRSAQQFPLAQRMMQVQSEIQAANLQEMEQQQRTRSTMQQFLAPRVAERIRATSARKYGAPAFKDEMFAYAVANGDVEPQSLTWMMQQLDGERDLDDLREAAKKHRSLLEGTRRSSAASPEAKAQSDALLIMLESENPKVLEKAVMQAAEAQQQQAMQAQRSQLAGMVAGGGQLTPEQSLIVMDDPALRRMQEQANRPMAPDPQRVAGLFQRYNVGDPAARAELIQLGQITPSAAFGGQRDAGVDRTAIKDEIAVLDDQIKDLSTSLKGKLNPDGTVTGEVTGKGVFNLRDSDAAQVEAMATRLQELTARRDEARNRLLNGGQSKSGGPVLLSELDAARAKQTIDQIRDALTRQLGRLPTRDEVKAAMSTQSQPPQGPR
jgi:hypothetical protein